LAEKVVAAVNAAAGPIPTAARLHSEQAAAAAAGNTAAFSDQTEQAEAAVIKVALVVQYRSLGPRSRFIRAAELNQKAARGETEGKAETQEIRTEAEVAEAEVVVALEGMSRSTTRSPFTTMEPSAYAAEREEWEELEGHLLAAVP
jgi:hypothetical protein